MSSSAEAQGSCSSDTNAVRIAGQRRGLNPTQKTYSVFPVRRELRGALSTPPWVPLLWVFLHPAAGATVGRLASRGDVGLVDSMCGPPVCKLRCAPWVLLTTVLGEKQVTGMQDKV